MAAAICADHGLTVISRFHTGAGSRWVGRVRDRTGRTFVLKVFSDPRVQPQVRYELDMLRAWQGAPPLVQLERELAHDAVLLNDIDGRPLTEPHRRTSDVARLLHHAHQVPARSHISQLADILIWDERPKRLSLAETDIMVQLAGPAASAAAGGHLCHGDAHAGNILDDGQQLWMIDPKGGVGNPAWDLCFHAMFTCAPAGTLRSLIASYPDRLDGIAELFAFLVMRTLRISRYPQFASLQPAVKPLADRLLSGEPASYLIGL